MAEHRKELWWSWISSSPACLAWFALIALLVRSIGFIPSSMGPDEALYLLQAREWLHGGWPYVAVWDMHPIGAPSLLAVGMLLFGESIASGRLLVLVAVVATAFLLHRLATLAGYSRALGFAAGALYISYTILPDGLTANTELLMAPFVAGGFVIAFLGARDLLCRARPPNLWLHFTMGLCFGIALCIKQVSAPEACTAFLALAAFSAHVLGLSWSVLITRALAFAAACALPTTVAGLVYLIRGDFQEFLEGSFLAPLRYAAHVEELDALAIGRIVLGAVIGATWLFVPATVAVFAGITHRRWPSQTALLCIGLLLWLAASTVGIILPGKFHAHYFLMWLPPLSLLAAIGLGEVVVWVAAQRRAAALFAATVLIGSLPSLSNIADRVRWGFGLRLPDPPRVVAEALARMVPQGQAAFLVNYEPIVYFLAGLPLPTRMPFWQHLSGEYGDVIGRSSNLELARVLASRPYILVVSRPHWDAVRPAAQQAITDMLDSSYELADTIQAGEGGIEVWRLR